MQVPDIAQTCLRHHRITQNLSSPSPQYSSRRLITLPEGSRVAHFGFLPGGRYAMVFMAEGELQLWDLQPYSDTTTFKVLDGTQAQRCMASYSCGFEPQTFNFVTCGEHERTVVSAAIADLSQ